MPADDRHSECLSGSVDSIFYLLFTHIRGECCRSREFDAPSCCVSLNLLQQQLPLLFVL